MITEEFKSKLTSSLTKIALLENEIQNNNKILHNLLISNNLITENLSTIRLYVADFLKNNTFQFDLTCTHFLTNTPENCTEITENPKNQKHNTESNAESNTESNNKSKINQNNNDNINEPDNSHFNISPYLSSPFKSNSMSSLERDNLLDLIKRKKKDLDDIYPNTKIIVPENQLLLLTQNPQLNNQLIENNHQFMIEVDDTDKSDNPSDYDGHHELDNNSRSNNNQNSQIAFLNDKSPLDDNILKKYKHSLLQFSNTPANLKLIQLSEKLERNSHRKLTRSLTKKFIHSSNSPSQNKITYGSTFKPEDLILASIPCFPDWPAYVLPLCDIPKNVLEKKSKFVDPNFPDAILIPIVMLSDISYYWCNESQLRFLTKRFINDEIIKIESFLETAQNRKQKYLNQSLLLAYKQALSCKNYYQDFKNNYLTKKFTKTKKIINNKNEKTNTPKNKEKQKISNNINKINTKSKKNRSKIVNIKNPLKRVDTKKRKIATLSSSLSLSPSLAKSSSPDFVLSMGSSNSLTPVLQYWDTRHNDNIENLNDGYVSISDDSSDASAESDLESVDSNTYHNTVKNSSILDDSSNQIEFEDKENLNNIKTLNRSIAMKKKRKLNRLKVRFSSVDFYDENLRFNNTNDQNTHEIIGNDLSSQSNNSLLHNDTPSNYLEINSLSTNGFEIPFTDFDDNDNLNQNNESKDSNTKMLEIVDTQNLSSSDHHQNKKIARVDSNTSLISQKDDSIDKNIVRIYGLLNSVNRRNIANENDSHIQNDLNVNNPQDSNNSNGFNIDKKYDSQLPKDNKTQIDGQYNKISTEINEILNHSIEEKISHEINVNCIEINNISHNINSFNGQNENTINGNQEKIIDQRTQFFDSYGKKKNSDTNENIEKNTWDHKNNETDENTYLKVNNQTDNNDGVPEKIIDKIQFQKDKEKGIEIQAKLVSFEKSSEVFYMNEKGIDKINNDKNKNSDTNNNSDMNNNVDTNINGDNDNDNDNNSTGDNIEINDIQSEVNSKNKTENKSKSIETNDIDNSKTKANKIKKKNKRTKKPIAKGLMKKKITSQYFEANPEEVSELNINDPRIADPPTSRTRSRFKIKSDAIFPEQNSFENLASKSLKMNLFN
ncbi:uncharacterized protein ASCRUDRAFT_70150 [Ascoidea rubescens DSM 1968]|uniref:PWWP domain-containing protein n=1 Tax=Ascoidea rubescens DSM 1968 TaxID=1344418 RepID=A0A1D2VJ80_9ASCO|nr:hypothetical protein ASCRUDRAFT_70150 [Ascoidea rubescens DSM 1968]ODV61688.1 hypothetical protein ASCRUDRAFT_70150 [Ascoidea rubescens DSM 1968]